MKLRLVWSQKCEDEARAVWLRARLAGRWVDYRDPVFKHWQLMNMTTRDVLLAHRAGLPAALIARLSGIKLEEIGNHIAVGRALAKSGMFRDAVEILTARVPTFGARWDREDICAGHDQAG